MSFFTRLIAPADAARAAGAAGLALAFLATPASALISFGGPEPLHDTATTDSAQSGLVSDQEPWLASDGGDTWIAAWSSSNDLGGSIGAELDIVYMRSTDDGRTWSPTAALAPNAATDLGSDSQVRVANGIGDVWVAVWSSRDPLGSTIDGDDDIFVSRSTDDGLTWDGPVALNSDAAADESNDFDVQPSIATDGAGNWVAVWSKQQRAGGILPNGNQIYYTYSSDDGATWATAVTLGNLMTDTLTLGFGQGTSVTHNGTDFVVIWGSTDDTGVGNDGDIFVSIIDGSSFTAGAVTALNSNAGSDTAHDMLPSIAAAGSTVVAFWEAQEGGDTDREMFTAHSSDGGATWGSVQSISGNGGSVVEQANARVATDGSEWIAVWATDDDLGKTVKTDEDIAYVRSSDGMTWSAPAGISTTAPKDKGLDAQPFVASDGDDTWMVAWHSDDALFNKPSGPDVVGNDDDILFVRSSVDCPAVPQSGCIGSVVAGKAVVSMKNTLSKDKFLFRIARGGAIDVAADLGDPTTGTTDDYLFCMYDQSGGTDELIIEMDANAGGNCYKAPCWKAVSTKGFGYKHKYGSLGAMKILGGADGLSKLLLKAPSHFQAPDLPLAQDTVVTAHVVNKGSGQCFGSTFSTAGKNDGVTYKANSD